MRAPLFNASLEAMECGGTLACVIQERNKLKAQVSHTACICVRLLCAVCMCALLCVPLCVPFFFFFSPSHPVSPLCSRYAAPLLKFGWTSDVVARQCADSTCRRSIKAEGRAFVVCDSFHVNTTSLRLALERVVHDMDVGCLARTAGRHRWRQQWFA